MRIRLSWIALVLIVLLPVLGRSESADNSNAADEKAIREIESRWEAAWNRHDVAAMAATYAPDADAINLAGEWFQGRDAFQKSLQELHSGKTQGSIWQTERTEIKFLTPEIAIVHVYANSHGDRNPDGCAMAPRRVILTRVDVKRSGKWLIVASQATNIVPRASAQNLSPAYGNSGQ